MMKNGFMTVAAVAISTAAFGLGGCTAGTTDSAPASTTAAAETTGATGPAGPQGADGATGASGPAGANGKDGAPGPQGAMGADGATGATGAAGASGPDGAAGAQGLPGAKGDQGVPGAKGDQGDAGFNSLVNVTNLAANDPHCPGGGLKIDVGIDTNRDGTLQASEIDQTTYSCAAVNRKRVIFATSQTYDGNLGGIAGADAKCMEAAAASPALAGKTFRAWVSTSSSSPSSSFTTDGSFVTVGGAKLADTFNNLRSGTLMAKITTESGASISTRTWTGTDENGFNAGADCNGWTDARASTNGARGNTDVLQWYWSVSEVTTCDLQGALYCFEQ